MAKIQSKKKLLNDEKEDESGGAGGITLSVEQLFSYLQAAFNKERRQRTDGQKNFAVCPPSKDPNDFLSKKNSSPYGFGESPQPHPLLSRTQQFSGVDDKLTPIPTENSEARKQFPEKRLENQLRLQKNLGLGASKRVTLAR